LRRSQEHELQRSELFKQSCKIRSSPIPRSERCDHGSDNREERYVQRNERSTEEGESERQGRECGIREVGSTPSDPNHGSRSRDAVQAGREEPEEFYGPQRSLTNTQRSGIEGKLQQQQREGEFRRCDSGYVANSNGQLSQGRSGEDRPIEAERHVGTPLRNDYWANFPTVAPVCMRNDELSFGLSGITFPKWRNESIKALGNAVVPALVYEIFKAIESYDPPPTSS